jgi:putative ABC transport system substrate-binding protein
MSARTRLAAAALAVGLAGAPGLAQAQSDKVPVIGWLALAAPGAAARVRAAFLTRLGELGYVPGRSIAIEYRYAEGKNERFPALAADLMKLRPDVIVTPCGPALAAVRASSRSVPVVATCADPTNFLGEIASVARPGGNTTGFTLFAPESAPKRIELLKQTLPRLSRVMVLHAAGDEQKETWDAMAGAGRSLGIAFEPVAAREIIDLERALAAGAKARGEALVVQTDAFTWFHRARIAELALKHRLPTMHDVREYVEAGGLMSYGTDLADLYRGAATYMDKILKGARAGDLPVQQPTRFELAINMKTARALGLTIPQSVLGRADKVIE